MKVAAQEIEHSQVVLDIEVEDERLERAVDQAYRRIAQQINVPGFRKGKAPRALVERMVGREALVEDAVEKLVPEVVEDAVKQQALVMVARPKLEVISTQPLQVKATVPVQPKVELGDYRSLKIGPEQAVVEDEQVDRVVGRLQEANATWEPVERPVEIGDRVAIDLLAKAGDTVVMDSKDAEYVVDPEGPQPTEGFAQALVGQAPGETRTFTLTLPEDYRNKELAGQEAEFTVTVHWVKARDLPPLDDDFAATIGTEYETLDQLRGAIRDNLLSREEHERRIEHEEKVIQAVVDQATVDLPPQMVEEEAGRLLQQMAQTLQRQGIPLDTYLRITQKSEDQFRSELMAQAERTVRRSEVLSAVAKAEGLEVTEEEVRQAIAETAENPNQANRVVREAMRRPEVRERVEAALRRQKAARFLLETVGGVDFAALEAEAEAEAAAESETGESEAAPAVAEAPAWSEEPTVASPEASLPADVETPAPAEPPAWTEEPSAAAEPSKSAESASDSSEPDQSESGTPAPRASGDTPA